MLGRRHVLLEAALGQGDVIAPRDGTRELGAVVLRDVNSLHVGLQRGAARKHHHTQVTFLLEATLVDKFLRKKEEENIKYIEFNSGQF